MKTRYTIWHEGCREGAFEFFCSTQSHFTSSRKEAKKELTSFRAGDYSDCGEVGQKYVLYKLTMEEVK